MPLLVANVKGPYKLVLKRDRMTIVDGTPVREASTIIPFGNTGKAWLDDSDPRLEMVKKSNQFKSGMVQIYQKPPRDDPDKKSDASTRYSKGPITTAHVKGK